MTCTSERSGKASSGVLSTATTPAITTNSVATSTRNGLRPDQPMTRESMAVASVADARPAGRVGRRVIRRTDARDHPFARTTFEELEIHRCSGLQAGEQ